jgi:uncharacterized Zn-finger protein
MLQSQVEFSTLDWLWKNSRHYLEHSKENKVGNYLSSHLQEIIPRVSTLGHLFVPGPLTLQLSHSEPGRADLLVEHILVHHSSRSTLKPSEVRSLHF